MTEYAMPNGVPSGHTCGAVLSRAFDARTAELGAVYEHQWEALRRPHDAADCVLCLARDELRPREDEHVLCAICRCCGLLAEEPEGGADFCAGGCVPPATPHAAAET